jgi:hypothetical protein
LFTAAGKLKRFFLTNSEARIIATAKNIDAPMLTRVRQELEYRIDVCRVTYGAHIKHL